MDIDDSYGNATNAYMYEWIKKNFRLRSNDMGIWR
jgi:hypothetical protein